MFFFCRMACFSQPAIKTKCLFYFCAMKWNLLVVLLWVGGAATAQKKITMYKTFGGVIYMLSDSLEISPKQTASILFTHPQAYPEFKKARGWSTASALTGFTGAAMVAIPLATLAFGEHADWGYAIGGSALIAIGLVCNQVYKARALYAIDLYNADLPQKTSRLRPRLQFYGTSACLVIKF